MYQVGIDIGSSAAKAAEGRLYNFLRKAGIEMAKHLWYD